MPAIRNFWPVAVYICMVPLNTDAIIPLGLVLGFSQDILLKLVPLLATIELCYCYWFWGWLIQRAGVLEEIRERRRRHQQDGILDRWFIDGILEMRRKALDPHNGTQKSINKYGVLAVWVFGLNPVPWLPTRAPTAAFLGATRRHREFYHLVVANFIHAASVIWAWGEILGR